MHFINHTHIGVYKSYTCPLTAWQCSSITGICMLFNGNITKWTVDILHLQTVDFLSASTSIYNFIFFRVRPRNQYSEMVTSFRAVGVMGFIKMRCGD